MTTPTPTPTTDKTSSTIRTGLAGVAIGAAALVGGLVALPALAGAQDEVTPEATEAPAERPDILADLVEEGVINQEQADIIRERFEEYRAEFGRGHRHHHGFGLRGEAGAIVSDLLGLTEAEIAEAFQNGTSLADLAAQQGVEVQTLVDALVAEAEANLAEKVADGTVTQERADSVLENLEQRIEERVNAERPLFEGRRGRGRFGPPATDDSSSTEDSGTSF